jgi:hypothetical protein
MKRPSEKLLKDMSNEELSAESEWHAAEAEKLLSEVNEMRETALGLTEQGAEEVLGSAIEKEAEAEAHIHQSNLLDALHASRFSDQGVSDVVSAAKA